MINLRNGIVPALLIGVMTACSGIRSNEHNGSDLSDRVRHEFSGDMARETVAILDQYVRWPGNRGFDASIDHIAEKLTLAGYVPESEATGDSRLTYRIEEYPMEQPAWEPVAATLYIEGESGPLLSFTSNRNMLATNSYATSPGGLTAELVYAGSGSSSELDAMDVRGKIVMAEGSLSRLFRNAVQDRGAAGVLAYSMPDYLQPEKNSDSIQFRSIPNDSTARSWGIALSFQAKEKLKAALANGPTRLTIETSVHWTRNAVERTVVADIHGSSHPDERFVFSAHVQEPGANDNASGVGAQVEMARVAALLCESGAIDPGRTISFLWGLEIRSTDRYIRQDSVRADGIRWGLSLDMVGEDTDKTGGTFLIEKMPDPSAIWTRGDESHTEWGGRPLQKEDMTPHYFNDLILEQALKQAATTDWVVKTNPYEGGSDHVPFLRANIPGVLLWHFTDQFYHTDRDRMDMVSSKEMKNVGVTALNTAFYLVSADAEQAAQLVETIKKAALERLEKEAALSLDATAKGSNQALERDILETWADWYDGALQRISEVEVGGVTEPTRSRIESARQSIRDKLTEVLRSLEM